MPYMSQSGNLLLISVLILFIPIFFKLNKTYLYILFSISFLSFFILIFNIYELKFLLNFFYFLVIISSFIVSLSVAKKTLIIYVLVFMFINLILSILKQEFLGISLSALSFLFLCIYFFKSILNVKN